MLVRDLHKIGYKPLLVGQSAMPIRRPSREQVGIPGALDRLLTINQVPATPTDPQAWRSGAS